MQAIEDKIADILSRARLSQGDDLLGFYYDLKNCLARGGLLANVEVRTTDDPRCLLIATGDTLQTPNDVGEYLTKQWLDYLCYQDFEAHEVTYEPQGVVLRFVTGANDLSLCVTGKIIVKPNIVEGM